MGDNGIVLARETGQREDAPHGGQFLTAEAADNARLTEQSFNGTIAAGNGSRMTAGCTAATLAGTCLDGCYATSLADERCGVIEHLVGVGNVFNVEQFHQRITFWVEVLVHVFQDSLDAYLLAISYRPYGIEGKPLGDSALKNEYGCGT